VPSNRLDSLLSLQLDSIRAKRHHRGGARQAKNAIRRDSSATARPHWERPKELHQLSHVPSPLEEINRFGPRAGGGRAIDVKRVANLYLAPNNLTLLDRSVRVPAPSSGGAR